MDRPSVSKAEWALTEEAFARFLAHLAPDGERAGQEYKNLHLTLVKFFDWRGAHFPEDCADETLNRVVRKLDAGEEIRDIKSYCHGVARLVLLETLKHPDGRNVSLDEATAVATSVPAAVSKASEEDETDARHRCFAHCLNELPAESQRLILEYYKEERRDKIDNRLAMAMALGIHLNALRSRAQRLRNKLEECVRRCLQREV